MSNGKTTRVIASFLVLGLLTSCAGSSVGDSVQQSLEADPQLEESPPFAANESGEMPDADVNADTRATDTPASDISDRRDPEFIGPERPATTRSSRYNATRDRVDQATTVPLTGVPTDLQTYIRDLQALNLLELGETTPDGERSTSDSEKSPFTQTITRREYARWLFDSHNTIYADEPSKRLRAGNPSDEPAFQDVSPTTPGFAEIQGLAEAGLIPSAFTGNSADVNFRPDAPLTREDLILWKVPLDTRAALPTTTPEAVQTSWGFQDTDNVDPLALRAIAADYQLGDFANFRRAFGYTTLFRPDKTVSRAEAAAVLWRFGTQTDGVTAAEGQAD